MHYATSVGALLYNARPLAAYQARARVLLGGMTTFRGYMLEVTLSDGALMLHGTTGPARVALAGQGHATDPVVPLAEVESVEWKPASALTNGRLTVRTSTGQRYVLHFRRKQQPDMERLRDLLP